MELVLNKLAFRSLVFKDLYWPAQALSGVMLCSSRHLFDLFLFASPSFFHSPDPSPIPLLLLRGFLRPRCWESSEIYYLASISLFFLFVVLFASETFPMSRLNTTWQQSPAFAFMFWSLCPVSRVRPGPLHRHPRVPLSDDLTAPPPAPALPFFLHIS